MFKYATTFFCLLIICSSCSTTNKNQPFIKLNESSNEHKSDNLVNEKKNLKTIKLPKEYLADVSFDKDRNQYILKLHVQESDPIKEEWINPYTDGNRSQIAHSWKPYQASSIILNINDKSAHINLREGKGSFLIEQFKIDLKSRPKSETAYIVVKDKTLDVSQSYQQIRQEIYELLNAEPPPNLTYPVEKLWYAYFSFDKVCSTNTNCMSIPRQNFYCSYLEDFNENLKQQHIVIQAGKKCRKWGRSWHKRQYEDLKYPNFSKLPSEEQIKVLKIAEEKAKEVRIEIPSRSPELEYAIDSFFMFYLGGTIRRAFDIQAIFNGSAPATDGMICFSKQTKDKWFNFFKEIIHRCYDWGEFSGY